MKVFIRNFTAWYYKFYRLISNFCQVNNFVVYILQLNKFVYYQYTCEECLSNACTSVEDASERSWLRTEWSIRVNGWIWHALEELPRIILVASFFVGLAMGEIGFDIYGAAGWKIRLPRVLWTAFLPDPFAFSGKELYLCERMAMWVRIALPKLLSRLGECGCVSMYNIYVMAIHSLAYLSWWHYW